MQLKLLQVMDVFRDLIGRWADKGDDRVVAFANGLLAGDREIWLSLMGHVKDLDTWLAPDNCFPPVDTEMTCRWLRDNRRFLDMLDTRPDLPPLDKVVSANGLFDISRKFIPNHDYVLEWDSSAQKARIRLTLRTHGPAEALLASGAVTAAEAFVIESSQCSLCGSEYRDCDCSKSLDSNVYEIVRVPHLVGVFWTDRPANPVLAARGESGRR